MKLFPILDQALVESQTRTPYAVREAKVWPSEASVTLFDQRKNSVVGRCHRQSYFRMTGAPNTKPIDAKGLRKMEIGNACEAHIVQLAQEAKIHVANGVKCFSEDIGMSFEIDLVVMDPDTHQGYLTENKSYASFVKAQDIKNGKPSNDNVMQALLYLNEIRTGKKLKHFIQQNIEAKLDHESRGSNRYQKFEVTLENLALMDDGPLKAKLTYEDRSECDGYEFDVSIYEDSYDDTHYPEIDGIPWKLFTVENIYERFSILQKYWLDAREEGRRRLKMKGIDLPDNPTSLDYEVFYERLAVEVRSLPSSFWPPADYQYKYSDEKIEFLWSEGLLGKTKYNEWKLVKAGRNRKPRPIPTIGDWNCKFCPFSNQCLSVEYPEIGMIAEDLIQLELQEEDEQVA